MHALKWLSEDLRPEDMLIFGFCGHGDVDDDTNFLIPVDGLRAVPQDTSIRLSRLFDWLDACPARRQVVLLDACHSSGLATDVRDEGLRGIRTVAKSSAREVDRQSQARGRAVLSSCSRDEVSYEDDRLRHGAFSYYLLDGLTGLAADRDREGRVTISELGGYVRTRVEAWCKGRRKSPPQTPRSVYTDTSGDIELVGGRRD